MTSPEQGIDLARSGWTNPDGLQRSPRPNIAPPPPPPACEAPGPGGLVCDLRPGHVPEDQHKADDGSAKGIRWTGPMANVQTVADREPRLVPAYDPAKIESVLIQLPPAPDDAERLARILHLADQALDSERPGVWSGTLMRIAEVARGE